MKRIDIFEKAIEEKIKDLRDYGINPTAFWGYRTSVDAENDLIDLSEVIWEDDVEEIATLFKQNDVTEFTISSTFSDLINTLAKFDEYGYKIVGLTEVNAQHRDFTTGKRARVKALRLACK